MFVFVCVCVEEDVCRCQSQSGQLADQYDVYEAACHFGTQPSYRGPNPALHHLYTGNSEQHLLQLDTLHSGLSGPDVLIYPEISAAASAHLVLQQ